MRCVDPFVRAGEVFPCGRCLPCKFRARRIWFHRVLLEASQHDFNSVVTLTYDEAAVPTTAQLDPSHLRNWLKRYRKRALERYPWRRLRFIACGEYGEVSKRPHYHVVLFGQPGCERGRTGRAWCQDCGCMTCADLVDTWSLGAVSVDRFTREGAAYVAGYVTRKVLANNTGMSVSPFLRMSNRPGIGAYAMHDVASTVLQYSLQVPVALGGQRPMYLGRYLRKKLSEFCGQEISAYVSSEALQKVQAVAWQSGTSVRSLLRQINEPFASQLSQREALREKVL